MIVFELKCLDGGETFEGWFSSSSEYDEQSERGLVQCPFCQSVRVEKAPMAPLVPRSARTSPIAELARIQARMLEGSTWVGERFSEQARAMHLGEMEPKPVHGQASPEEARSLAEDGVPVMPLPLPVVPPGQVN